MSVVALTAARIKTTMLTVSNVGQVYDYHPFPRAEWNEYVAKFTATVSGQTVVRAWTIKNIGRKTVPISLAPSSEVQRLELDWLVRGFMGLDDPTSEQAFVDLLETVTEALNADRSLGGVADALDHDPADYTLPNNGALLALGDTICHYAEVTFTSYHNHVIAVS